MTNDTRCTPDSPSMGNRAKANEELRGMLAQRMLDARTISGLDQTRAAHLLGYANSTQLSLVEQGRRMPPYEVLIRAADFYEVSLDFLLGRSDSPERNDQLAGRNAVMRTAADILESSAARLADQLQHELRFGTRSTAVARNLAVRASTAAQALANFRQLNVDCFDELRGGASLLHAVRELQDATTAVQDTFNMQRAQQPHERRHRV